MQKNTGSFIFMIRLMYFVLKDAIDFKHFGIKHALKKGLREYALTVWLNLLSMIRKLYALFASRFK